MAGRPTKYTKELADQICNLIANSEYGLRRVAKEVGVVPETIRTWLIQYPEFLAQYARAKEEQADFLADQIIEIADDSLNDTQVGEDGKPVLNYDHIQRSRLRVDARKWKASKLAPKKYGERVDLTTNGQEIKQSVVLLPHNGRELLKPPTGLPD